jgi:transposase
MSKKELTRLEVMQRLKEKRLTQKEAARLLGLSTRQIKRLWRAYRQQGAKGLVSVRRGQASNNRLDARIVQQALDLIEEKYRDFGPTLAHEKLTEVHHLGISRESVRRIMIEAGIWKPKRAKQPSAHQMRERRACFGELVQIDGSDHAWFEGRGPKCTLLVYIDDATGQLLEFYHKASPGRSRRWSLGSLGFESTTTSLPPKDFPKTHELKKSPQHLRGFGNSITGAELRTAPTRRRRLLPSCWGPTSRSPYRLW